MSKPIVTLVTGAVSDFTIKAFPTSIPSQNRGIGEAICQILVDTIQQPMTLYAASRRGIDYNIKPAPSSTQLKYSKLDITQPSSIANLAALIKEEHGGLDVLINNAGINLDDDYTSKNVAKTLNTNYRGTLHVSKESLTSNSRSQVLNQPDVPNLPPASPSQRTHREHLLHSLRPTRLQPPLAAKIP